MYFGVGNPEDEMRMYLALAQQMLAGGPVDYSEELALLEAPPEKISGGMKMKPPEKKQRDFSEQPLMGGFGLPGDVPISDFVGRITSDQVRSGGDKRRDRPVSQEALKSERGYSAKEIDFPGDLGMTLTPEENMMRFLLGNRWTPEGRQAGSEVLAQHLGNMARQASEQEQIGMQRELGLAELAQQEALTRMQLEQAQSAATMDFLAKLKEAEASERYWGGRKEKEERSAQATAERATDRENEKIIKYYADLARGSGMGDKSDDLDLYFEMQGIVDSRAKEKWKDLVVQREMAFMHNDLQAVEEIERQIRDLGFFGSLR